MRRREHRKPRARALAQDVVSTTFMRDTFMQLSCETQNLEMVILEIWLHFDELCVVVVIGATINADHLCDVWMQTVNFTKVLIGCRG